LILHTALIKQFYVQINNDNHTRAVLNNLDEQVKTYITTDSTNCEDEERDFKVEFEGISHTFLYIQ
jgi:hypothetical protein